MNHALRSRMINELFANGRCRNGVLPVCTSLAAEEGTTLDAAGLAVFARQADREYAALSGDAAEVAGLRGIPGESLKAERAVQLALKSRYADGLGPGHWLWQDSDLRGLLADALLHGLQLGKTEPAIVGDMEAILKDNSVPATPPVIASPPVPYAVSLPDSVPAGRNNIGSFGPVGFQVSRETVHTLHELSRKRSARYAEHAVLHTAPKLQFMGMGLWEVSFRIRLAAAFCNDPATRITTLEEVQASGKAHTLVIGGRNLGPFVLADIDVTERTHGPKGMLMAADIAVTIKEYR